MAKITGIELGTKRNIAWYNDNDSMTDYFHMTEGSLTFITERIKEQGADAIKVTPSNNNITRFPFLKRLQNLAKKCGYKVNDLSRFKPMAFGPDQFVYEFELVKL